jgi:hypothetical protein
MVISITEKQVLKSQEDQRKAQVLKPKKEINNNLLENILIARLSPDLNHQEKVQPQLTKDPLRSKNYNKNKKRNWKRNKENKSNIV